MKNQQIVKALVAAGLTLAAGIAAADTQSVSSSASITGVCKFNSGQTPALAFGAIDPSGSSNATATANVLYRCTNGTSATVSSAVTGTRSMAGSGTAVGQTLAYTLSFTSGATGTGTGFGSGNDLTLVLGGSITPTQYQNATVGSYSENVTLTVSP